MRILRNFVLLIVVTSCAPAFAQAPRSIVFDGSSYLRAVWPSSPGASFSFEVWVYPTSSGHASYLLYQGDSTSSGFGLALESNWLPATFATITVGGQEEPVTGNSARLPTGQWTHLAFVKDSSLWSFYRNGVKIGRRHYDPDSIPLPLIVGRGFAGSLADIRIWNRALTDSEIVSQLYVQIPDTSSGLVGHWPSSAESIGTHTSLANTATGLAALQCVGATGAARVAISASAPPQYTMARPTVRLSQFPRHQQLFPRSTRASATIAVRGEVVTPGIDSVLFELWRNDVLLRTTHTATNYSSGAAPFAFQDSIRVECAEYTVRLLLKQGALVYPVAEAADLVAGDAFFINGQSNAHPAIFGEFWENQFARSFGVQTSNWNLVAYDPADTFWGLANGSGWGEWFAGPYLAGAWGYGMQDRIATNRQVPTCIINGAAGNTSIRDHYRNDQKPLDLATVYGRALYRLTKSETLPHLRAIFWYQGEYDSGRSYYGKFVKLRNQWKEDIPYDDAAIARQTLYVFQTRPGCDESDGALREVQRTMQDSIPGVKVLSTTAVNGHNGCHYWWWGCDAQGAEVYAVVNRDYYGGTDTAYLNPPNVAEVGFGDSLHRTLRVRFRERDPSLTFTQDSVFAGKLRTKADAFLLDAMPGEVEQASIANGELTLQLKSGVQPRYLTYIPDIFYANDTVIYEGPWIVNGRGIGALTFDSIPIGEYAPDLGNAGTAFGQVHYRCELRHILGHPTLVIESAGALMGSLQTVDEVGRTLSSIPVALGAGDSSIPLDSAPLPAGPTFVQFSANGQTSLFKFVSETLP